MAETSETSIPAGSLVLVTGVNGYVGSQVARHFLSRGFGVRGAVRDVSRAGWLLEQVALGAGPVRARGGAGPGRRGVGRGRARGGGPGRGGRGARGQRGVVGRGPAQGGGADGGRGHGAARGGASQAVGAALRLHGVGGGGGNAAAAGQQRAGRAGRRARRRRRGIVERRGRGARVGAAALRARARRRAYTASKVAAEKAVWQFVRDRQPHFVVNSVAPCTIIGEPLHESQVASGTPLGQAAVRRQARPAQGHADE